jgi:hypothetical protein
MPTGKGVAMAGSRPQRAEIRTPIRVFVELSSFENVSYELTYTVNVSRRGARILSKDPWNPNQRLSVRSIGGNLDSRARIAYCYPAESGTFAIGLQLDHPTYEWGPPSKENP